MSEETPAAPAETSTPTTPAPEAAPATPAEQPAAQPEVTAPAESAPYFSNEQLAEMQKFIENNGGYDTAWKKMKAGISAPQSVAQPEVPQTPSQPQNVQQPTEQPQAPQNTSQSVRAGSYSLEELAAQSYFERLAGEEKYASIADEIRDGKVLKGLKDFNITPISDGRVNDADIRKYLDLYAASKPAKPTSSEPSASAVEYYKTANDGEVTSMEEANRIQLQSIQLRNSGQPPHPLEEKAKAFVREYYSKGLDRKQ